ASGADLQAHHRSARDLGSRGKLMNLGKTFGRVGGLAVAVAVLDYRFLLGSLLDADWGRGRGRGESLWTVDSEAADRRAADRQIDHGRTASGRSAARSGDDRRR